MGVEIELGPDVLVPRDETELLGKNSVSILGRIESAPIVVDMCCGSGNLAVAIASHCVEARIWAADLTDSTVTMFFNQYFYDVVFLGLFFVPVFSVEEHNDIGILLNTT